MAAVLGRSDGVEGTLCWLRKADSLDYLFATRRVLAAWIYFKRFAESILKVTASDAGKG